MKSIDTAVEKVVLHLKLCDKEKMENAKMMLDPDDPEDSLLQILVNLQIISTAHAGKIEPQAKKIAAQIESKRAAAKPATSSPSSPPPITVAVSDDVDFKTMSLMDLLKYGTEKGSSDLHIHVDYPPMLRNDGALHNLGHTPFSAQETEKLLFDALNEELSNKLKENLSLDTCLEIEGVGRFRTCITKQRLGWDGSFHIIPNGIPTFENLHLPEHLKKLTEYPQGLVLIAGPSGSGKSSTLAAMIEHINVNRNEHIITLEDPVEFLFEPKQSHISQRQIGDNTKSYSNALRAALREDPDIIMLGELRDAETASLAISASETGHLVFTTLHTTSAAKTINRVLDIFPPMEQLQIRSMISQSLRGIACQKLVPKKEGGGRMIAQEIMFNIPAVGNLIRENRMLQLPSVMQTKSRMGMQLMDARLKEMLAENMISEEEAYYAAENIKQFKKPMRNR